MPNLQPVNDYSFTSWGELVVAWCANNWVDGVKFVACSTIPDVLPWQNLETRGISSQAGSFMLVTVRSRAALAAVSALSLPGMFTWLGGRARRSSQNTKDKQSASGKEERRWEVEGILWRHSHTLRCQQTQMISIRIWCQQRSPKVMIWKLMCMMTRKHFFSLVVASDGQFDILHLPPSRQCAIDCQCQRSLFSIRIYTVKHKNRIFYFWP